MAPWVVLVIVAILAVCGKWTGADTSMIQLLATIAGICGGVLKVADNLLRKSDGQ
jgi:Flp pilus assembly protein protease CpaA